MKFLIHSQGGDGAGLAWKLQDEGHDVTLFIEEAFSKPLLTGMVPKVSSMEEGLAKKPDVIVYDMTGSGAEADALKKKGFRVVGASAFCDVLELDRTFAMRIAGKAGITTPPFTVFKQNEIFKAIQHIEDSGKRFVLKPHDNLSLDMTYVAKDPGDMIQMLEWADKKKILKGDFLLQEFIKGLEISTEMWFSNGEMVPQLCNGTIEIKKFLTGDLGPATGCESSIVWPYVSEQSKIVLQTIGKMAPYIKKYGYTGPIDVNAIVKDGEAYFLEFTPRFGYSALYAFCELIEGKVGDFLYSLAIKNTADLALKKKVSMALTVSIPPYPLDSGKSQNQDAFRKSSGKRVFNPPEEGFWPFDVKSDGQDLVVAGTLGLLAYVSATGDNVEEAEEKVYEKVEEINASDIQYRVDGAVRAEKDIPELEKQDYDVPLLCEPMEMEEEDAA